MIYELSDLTPSFIVVFLLLAVTVFMLCKTFNNREILKNPQGAEYVPYAILRRTNGDISFADAVKCLKRIQK